MKKEETLSNKLAWLVVGVALGGMAIGLFLSMNRRVQPAAIYITPPAPTATAVATATPSAIIIFVNGEVVQPDLYELPPGSRVEQAIRAAGGFTSDANQAVINLAEPLHDGAQVFVPAVTDVAVVPVAGVTTSSSFPTTTTTTTAKETGATAVSGNIININTATLADLDTLPGIGPSTAQNILDYRDANGDFPTIEAIMNVSGIGPARFEAIKALITVE